MEVRKQADILSAGVPSDAQLEKINLQAKSPMAKEDVYIFSVRLCDDQIDRDYERFLTDALAPLAVMFIGKTGIVDHAWSSEKQTARVFDAGVEYENGAAYIKAWAYILRSDKTLDVIREIEAGIKKEVSVGCAMGRSICSVCGADYGTCEHRKGERYGAEVCVAVLCEPIDAYEFSFVAVPAQKHAGVLKQMGMSQADEKKLDQEAKLGRMYRAELEEEAVKLALLLEIGPEQAVWKQMVSSLDGEQLVRVKKQLQKKAQAMYPPVCQLHTKQEIALESDSAFLI